MHPRTALKRHPGVSRTPDSTGGEWRRAQNSIINSDLHQGGYIMVFGLFGKKKPQFSLEPRQEVEIDITLPDGNFESYFTRVLELAKKKFTLAIPEKDRVQIPVSAGEIVTIVYLVGDTLYQFQTRIIDRKEKEIDLQIPRELKEEKTFLAQSEFCVEIPIPIKYRAMSTAHLQNAMTRCITNAGIQIMTNLPIPIATALNIELEIPNAPPIKTKGKVTSSQKTGAEAKKSITEIEFEDINPADKDTILRYGTFFYYQNKRREALQLPPSQ
jgi:c-di-GMP-binding flagellar brake protein YcgR